MQTEVLCKVFCKVQDYRKFQDYKTCKFCAKCVDEMKRMKGKVNSLIKIVMKITMKVVEFIIKIIIKLAIKIIIKNSHQNHNLCNCSEGVHDLPPFCGSEGAL